MHAAALQTPGASPALQAVPSGGAVAADDARRVDVQAGRQLVATSQTIAATNARRMRQRMPGGSTSCEV
jgi:hypothetical protein